MFQRHPAEADPLDRVAGAAAGAGQHGPQWPAGAGRRQLPRGLHRRQPHPRARRRPQDDRPAQGNHHAPPRRGLGMAQNNIIR